MAKGKINVAVENIFPLIKKFLYSDHEIFLRELISNATDATLKLKHLSNIGELKDDYGNPIIEVKIDKKNKSLHIIDQGIGMTGDEIKKYINEVAFSGAEEFLEKYKDSAKDSGIIGHFGLGFYSAFMVSSEIHVTTRRAGEKKVWIWKSDGESKFSIMENDDLNLLNSNRGTRIDLQIEKENKEFLDKIRIEQIIRKYSDHISIPILVTDGSEKDDDKLEPVNSASAIWTRPKNKITKEQYKEFYNHVGQMFDDPWMTSHYKAEGKIEYTVLNFIPSTKPFDLYDPARENRLKLYVKKVFITDNCPDLVPPYLRFLRGVIDSEDLPLNISREMLQNNPVVTKIRSSLVKRTISDLRKKLNSDKTDYTSFWNSFGPVLKEGIYEDVERKESLLEIALFKQSASSELITLNDYISNMQKKQKDIYFITGDNYESIINNPSLEGYKSRNINVLILDDPVDSFWTSSTPSYKENNFKSVTQGIDDLDKLGKKTEEDINEKSVDSLLVFLKEKLKEKVKDVRVSKRLTDSPVCLVSDEGAMDPHLEKILKQHNQLNQGISLKIMEINPNHSLIKKLDKMSKNKDKIGDLENIAILLYEQSKILDGDKPTNPVEFSKKLIETISSSIN